MIENKIEREWDARVATEREQATCVATEERVTAILDRLEQCRANTWRDEVGQADVTVLTDAMDEVRYLHARVNVADSRRLDLYLANVGLIDHNEALTDAVEMLEDLRATDQEASCHDEDASALYRDGTMSWDSERDHAHELADDFRNRMNMEIDELMDEYLAQQHRIYNLGLEQSPSRKTVCPQCPCPQCHQTRYRDIAK
jgi:hypothetical protein